jgi:hypothetical protein
VCNTTGEGTKKAFLAEYRRIVNAYKAKLRYYKSNIAAKKSALSKLTAEEIKALQELGV